MAVCLSDSQGEKAGGWCGRIDDGLCPLDRGITCPQDHLVPSAQPSEEPDLKLSPLVFVC